MGVLQIHDIRDSDPSNPHGGTNEDCTGTLCPDCGCCMHCAGPECCVGVCRDSQCGCSL